MAMGGWWLLCWTQRSHLLFSQGVVCGLYADIILGDMLVIFNTCNHYGFASCVLGKTSSHPRSQTSLISLILLLRKRLL